ncbi:phosphoribosylanthranilate isomerase [Roseofilum casamattae]|uniref:N-(5'-phosphoribosyl)anthranilate isomerase n=1 Tax=Roseofilum casamattae BLCC-M143 TaxID=3022442 RepID=A0ABT7BRE9_9CYAN|nr:phosphoribosylanthranilate isomerase [Roseofilum casamattae]MDJ1181769.1 phosphoribosylanthranilate isomerase [Roseofilum casamattae BLCC-M143]
MRIKICGITQAEQGAAIANLGATALGFICSPSSPRYVRAEQIANIREYLPASIDRIGVFVNASMEEISKTVEIGDLTGVQLHGDESPEFCQQLRQHLPDIESIKAFRVRHLSPEVLNTIAAYQSSVDTLLLDAYHPTQWGGTGHTLNWQDLASFLPPLPWFLAGGLTPENIQHALQHVSPDGIDLSSGVERAPGNKDPNKVKYLLEQLT